MAGIKLVRDTDGALRVYGWVGLDAQEKERRLDVARALWPTRMSRRQIARESGVPFNALMRALQPGYAERELARQRDRDKQHRRERRASTRTKADGTPALFTEPRPRDADVAARLAEIPEDTRTITARLMGDPLPGRRAIDQRRVV